MSPSVAAAADAVNDNDRWLLLDQAIESVASHETVPLREIIAAVRNTAPQDTLRLFLVDSDNSQRANDAVYTTAGLRARWPGLFEHGGPDDASAMWTALLDKPAEHGRVVVHRLLLNERTLDLAFGANPGPVTTHIRHMVATGPSSP